MHKTIQRFVKREALFFLGVGFGDKVLVKITIDIVARF